MPSEPSDPGRPGARPGLPDWVVGGAVLGAGLTGCVAFVLAVVATFTGPWPLAAAALLAAAVAFGLLANALIRR